MWRLMRTIGFNSTMGGIVQNAILFACDIGLMLMEEGKPVVSLVSYHVLTVLFWIFMKLVF